MDWVAGSVDSEGLAAGLVEVKVVADSAAELAAEG
jgi:hypothetical protein